MKKHQGTITSKHFCDYKPVQSYSYDYGVMQMEET